MRNPDQHKCKRISWIALAILFGIISRDLAASPAKAVHDLGATELLNYISPQQLLAERLRTENGRFKSPAVRDGVPDGVQCNVTQRCDSRNVCAKVCSRGSVQLDPWLQAAVDYQWRLARRQPLCFTQLLGTHNSAITLADGYGMHDDIYTSYLRYLRLASPSEALVTNNQLLSLTDQLRLGVRFVELDVHWIQDALRISHCGGLHSPRLNELVGWLNRVAALFGQPPVEWDAETVGCNPSMSSLPVADQRLFSDALAEVASWLLGDTATRPSSPSPAPPEFLVLYLDDQLDLQAWGKVQLLLKQVTDAIPLNLFITPSELEEIVRQQRSLPSIDQLVHVYGKRVLLMSASDYGSEMSHMAFNHRSPCDFAEPQFRTFRGSPNCSFVSWRYPNSQPVMTGRMIRSPTCHLTYGPYNCSMQRGWNDAQLDAEKLPQATSCGINVPSPDMLAPELVQSYIWSWAPGHPPLPPPKRRADGEVTEAEVADDGLREAPRQCAQLRASDGRWVVRPCGAAQHAACRRDAGPQHQASDVAWVLAAPAPDSPPPACPHGYLPGAPHTARENFDLWQLVHQQQQQQQAQHLVQAQDRMGQESDSEVAVCSAQRRALRRMAAAARAGSPGRAVQGGGGGAVGKGAEGEVYVQLALEPPSWLPRE